jgi:methylglutaconyl-CoA hydratase
MPYEYLLVTRDGPVEHVTLNRPVVRNAFDDRMVAELAAWAEALAERGEVRVAVISGAGDVFCAGADLKWMTRMAGYSKEENLGDADALARMYSAIDALPVPLVGRVHGAALAGGLGLVAVCDIVVAEEGAVFGLTEVKLGLVPSVIAPYVLAKIGRSAVRELFLTGARFSAGRAEVLGLVHAVVPAGELDAKVDRYVHELLSSAPEAMATAKQLVRQVWNVRPEEAASLTTEVIAARRVSPEGQEGMRAFLERRKASWVVR